MPADPKQAEEIRRIDKILASEIGESILRESLERQDILIRVLGETQPGSTKLRPSQPNYLGPKDAAHLTVSKGEMPRLVVQDFLLSHPLGRITMQHEFSHLSRLHAGDVSPAQAYRFFNRQNEKPMNVYKEELKSFKDEWNFMRVAFTKGDLVRLHKIYPGVQSDDIKALQKAGILATHGKTKWAPNLKARGATDPKTQEALRRYLEGGLNEKFTTSVSEAFRLSRSEYAKTNIRKSSHYRDQQVQATGLMKEKRARRKAILTFLGLGAGSALQSDSEEEK